MKNETKLIKGDLYFAAVDGRVNFGYYLGRVPGFRLFRGADFSFTHNDLERGISDEVFDKTFFLWVPKDKANQNYGKAAMEYVDKYLQE